MGKESVDNTIYPSTKKEEGMIAQTIDVSQSQVQWTDYIGEFFET